MGRHMDGSGMAITLRTAVVAGLLAWMTGTLTAAEPEPPREGWSSGLQAGLNLSRGNTKNLLLNGGLQTEYRRGDNEFRLDLQGNYGESTLNRGATNATDETTVQNARGVADYRRLLSERTYAYANAELANDEIAAVDYRLIAGPGAGYFVLKNDRQRLSAEAGVAYVRQRLAHEDNDTFNLRAAQRYELALPAGAKFWESAEYMPAFEDFDNYLARFELGAEAVMTELVNLRVVFQDQYNNMPAPGKERNDLQLIAGVSVKL